MPPKHKHDLVKPPEKYSNFPQKPTTYSTGGLWRNPNTDFIVVTLLNETTLPQTLTVSVVDWKSCSQTEFGKFAYLCGQLLIPPTPGAQPEGSNNPSSTFQLGALAMPAPTPTPAPPPIVIPDVPLIVTPFTFKIPARSLLTVYAVPPTAWNPPDPIYEVRVTFPGVTRYVIVNTYGISSFGVPQEGNTVLHHQFVQLPAGIL